jgi:hypothetical protein
VKFSGYSEYITYIRLVLKSIYISYLVPPPARNITHLFKIEPGLSLDAYSLEHLPFRKIEYAQAATKKPQGGEV